MPGLGLDPGSIASAALGIGQTIGGLIGAHKAKKGLENLATPTVAADAGIQQYYKTALNRFNTSPQNSQMYQLQQQQAQRGLSSGLNALRTNRGLVGNVSALTQGYDDSLMKAGAQAEQQKALQFNQLGKATQMQNADNRYQFNINQLMPYQAKKSLLESKLAGSNQIVGAGLTNLGNAAGLQNYADVNKYRPQKNFTISNF